MHRRRRLCPPGTLGIVFECVAGDESDCEGTCREHGRRTLRDDKCRPATDADCEGSIARSEYGLCHTDRYLCVP